MTVVDSFGILKLNQAERDGLYVVHSDIYPTGFPNVFMWTADHKPSWYAYGIAPSIEACQSDVETIFAAALVASGYAKPDEPTEVYRSNRAMYDLHPYPKKVPDA